MVRDFHRIIGEETKKQFLEKEGKLPDEMIACVGGGSNAIGFFFDFLEDLDVRLVGVEAGGRSLVEGEHAARFEGGKLGILQGCKTWILQNKDGQINQTHSVSAGLDYAAIGPEHAFYRDRGRIDFANAGDEDALEAFKMLSSEEGILPALETSHGLAYAFKRAGELTKDNIICVNLSGRGDKDAMEAARVMGVKDLPDMHL
jgi:tryptophan synthase beta chain